MPAGKKLAEIEYAPKFEKFSSKKKKENRKEKREKRRALIRQSAVCRLLQLAL